MMKPLRDGEKALRKLRTMTAADTAPVLSDEEILDLFDECRIADVWTPGTVVRPGQVIVPTVPTGWSYNVAPWRDRDGDVGGITGTTEPRWPLDPRWPSWEPTEVTDGTVRFVIHKAEIMGLWDLQSAAHNGWMLKAAKTSSMYAVGTEAGNMHPEQVHAQCLAMARTFSPLRIS
ncbi:MAG TPA: hypothetical protein VGM51_09590 [Armatimonadota bacterium]|jgi:hypothetical protein